MTIIILFIGLIGFSIADQPVVDFSQSFVNQNGLAQIEQLKKRHWTASRTDQHVLWTAFWYSRMNIIAEDPDIFERSIDILTDLSIKYPTEISEGMLNLQCPVLSNVIDQHLETQYNHTITSLQRKQLKAICQNLVTETLKDVDISKWLISWSSPGGSVGVELWRGTLAAYIGHEENPLHKAIALDWSLDRPPQLKPPRYISGQVEGQPVPQEPMVNLIQFEKPWHISPVFMCVCLGLLALTFRKNRLPRTLFLSTLLLSGLEWLSALFTTPLIDSKPMFQIEGWQITPWTETTTHFETHGDYLRTQVISKDPSLPRVVILGASSAHGSNELWEDSFAGILQQNMDWDIVNLGIGGTTSTGLVHLRDNIQVLNPSALIIYYGHNEVRQFRLMSQHQRISPWRYRTQRILWQSSIYTTLYTLLQTESTSFPDSDIHVGNTSTTPDTEIVQLAQWNFESNLSLICSSLEIPILLIIPPTNYPFAPMTEVNTLPNTLTEIQDLIDIHPEATTIHSSIKESIPKVAKTCGATMWDVDAHFHMNSPDGTSANGLFWDELHPSALGHQWIARGLQQWLETLPPSNGQQID